MRLLVTGGAGFIGSNFIRYWLGKYPHDRIVNLDKLTYAGNPRNLIDLKEKTNYRFVKGDIVDGKLVNKLVSEADVVVHFAAESHVDRSIVGPQLFVKTNVLGTQVLLDAAKRHRIKRFHHISTDEVFGSLTLYSKKKFNEKTPYAPRSPYSASKAASDHLVLTYSHTYGLPVTITNCSNNYGPYQHPEKLIPLAITNLIEGKKIPVYGDGLYVRDWLYVEDHCRAIDLVIKKGKPGEVYCVGGTVKQVNNLQLAKMICRLLEKKPKRWVEFVEDRPGHDRRYAVDWQKVKKIGWKPRQDFQTGLEKTVNWYIQNENWWRCLKNRPKPEV